MSDTSPDEVERQLAELDAIRRRVMNVIGHALRTPMATLRGLVEVVAKNPEAAKQEELTDALVRTTRRLERLLDDVLVASDVSTRLPTASAREVDLVQAVRTAWIEAGQDDEGLVIEGSARARVGNDALRWILFHLVDNAVRYGVQPVTVALGEADGMARIECRSPGPELNEADLRNAFELFYRGEAAVMKNTSGMGVGLPVVARLAEHSGGTVAIDALEGGGVVTVVELPAP